MAVCSSRMLKWFPFNPSLSEEMERLFAPASDSYEDIMEEFRANGQDSEYCPDSEEEMPAGGLRGPGSRQRRGKTLAGGASMARAPPPAPPVVAAQGQVSTLALALRPPPPSAASVPPPPVAPPAPSASAAAAFALGLLPSLPPAAGLHCAFCRNNGETVAFYSGHILKDAKGRVQCPILRAYTCPNCGANGDRAHTLKYCPMGAAVAAALEWPSSVPALAPASPPAPASTRGPAAAGGGGGGARAVVSMGTAQRGPSLKGAVAAPAGGRRRRSYRRSY